MDTNGDKEIRDAMMSEQYEAFEEEGIFKQMLGTVSGRNAWVGIIGFLYTLAFTVIFFFAGFKFFTIETMESRLFWGVIMLLMAAFIAQLKMWFFIQASRNTLIRELKRMELQVAKLSERVGK